MEKNFLITTGGSGGHVIPATILYEHLSKKLNVLISTDKRGTKYLNKEIYQYEIIDTPRLNNIFLLIIQHNPTYLSAYGHNDRLIVSEGDLVEQGQVIAAMGLGPGQQPQLHFEIRRNGASVDPLSYLPR